MKARTLSFLFAAFTLGTTGCSWIRIADGPTYDRQPMHFGSCGIEVSKNEVSMQYAPKFVERLRDWKLFDSIVYPYRDSDKVDHILLLTVEGGFTDAGSGGNGFLIGLSLFTLSPFVGPKIKGNYSANTTISKGGKEQFTCRAEDQQTTEFGLGANTSEVSRQATQLAIDQLTFQIAQCLVENLQVR